MSLSNKVKTAVMAAVLTVIGVGAVVTTDVFASNCTCTKNGSTITYAESCTEAEKGMALAGGCTGTTAQPLENTITKIVNAALYVIGILAVVMVIIGGVKYTTSGGDQAAVTSAKNTILYGIIGLVIAILAYAIVNFVISRVTASNNNVLVGPPVSV